MARPVSMILFLCGGLATSGAASAQSLEPSDGLSAAALDAVSAESFATKLLREGDPFNALTFYRLSEALTDEPGAELYFRMALCYELGDRFHDAEAAYLDLAGRDPAWSGRATYRAAMSATASGRPAEAALHLQDVQLEGQGTPLAMQAAFMTGVVALDAGDPVSAQAAFQAFDLAYPDHPLVVRSRAAQAVLEQRVPRRSPAAAGLLSLVLPGAGQLYAGHAGDAAMAFLASGVLGLWSYSLVRSGVEDERGWRIGAGAALGTVATFTWSSNVFGAVRGARRTNVYLRKKRADNVRRETADPLLEASAEDVLSGL
jgi:uncharacterized membrane protein